MRTMSSESRRARGGRGVACGLRLAIAIGVAAGGWFAAARPAAAAPVMSRDQQADASDDWTLHMAIGLDLGAGGTITDFNELPGPDGTLFFTAVRGTYDLKHGFAAMLTLRQWWLPGPNHALIIGFGTRFEPFVYTWGRIFFDAALGPASTSNAWTFGFDLGAGLEFDLPDVPGFSIGPYFRYGHFINPDKRDTQRRSRLDRGRLVHLPLRPGGAGAEDQLGTRGEARRLAHQHPRHRRTESPTTRISARTRPPAPTPTPSVLAAPRTTRTATGCPTSTTPARSRRRARSPIPSGPAVPFLDADGDGISDADDACPTKAGVASTDPAKNGCPDGHKKAAPAALAAAVERGRDAAQAGEEAASRQAVDGRPGASGSIEPNQLTTIATRTIAQ